MSNETSELKRRPKRLKRHAKFTISRAKVKRRRPPAFRSGHESYQTTPARYRSPAPGSRPKFCPAVNPPCNPRQSRRDTRRLRRETRRDYGHDSPGKERRAGRSGQTSGRNPTERVGFLFVGHKPVPGRHNAFVRPLPVGPDQANPHFQDTLRACGARTPSSSK